MSNTIQYIHRYQQYKVNSLSVLFDLTHFCIVVSSVQHYITIFENIRNNRLFYTLFIERETQNDLVTMRATK